MIPRAMVVDTRAVLILALAIAPWTAWRAVRRAVRRHS